MVRHGQGGEEPSGEGAKVDTVQLTQATLLMDEPALKVNPRMPVGVLDAIDAADGGPGLRPVTLQAQNPSGTTFGQAVTTRLPAGVDESSVLRQITDALQLKNLGRKQTAEIQLHPAELGKVNVKLQFEAGVARIFVGTEHAGVADLVANGLEQLRQQLLAQGVQVEHFEVAHHGAGADGDGDGEGPGNEEDGLEDSERSSSKESTVATRRHDGRINVKA